MKSEYNLNSRVGSRVPDVDGAVEGARYDLIPVVVVMKRNYFRRVALQQAQFLTCRIGLRSDLIFILVLSIKTNNCSFEDGHSIYST